MKKYNSQHVMDFYKDQFISRNTRQNHIQNTLLLNSDFYDTIHSSAIMDHKGRIYYFKQDKNIRTLYRSKKPLWSFPSYYAYPVEADEEGIYFISATKYGSSLFVYKESEGVFRLSESDTISYARKIKGNEFLVSEITPTHHVYKVIQTKSLPEQPVLYTYSFKKEDVFEQSPKNLSLNKREQSLKSDKSVKAPVQALNFKDQKSDKSVLRDLPQEKGAAHLKNSKSLKDDKMKDSDEGFFSSEGFSASQITPHQLYNPLKNLSLQNIFLFFSPAPALISSFRFLDPLQFNKLLLSYILSKKQEFLHCLMLIKSIGRFLQFL